MGTMDYICAALNKKFHTYVKRELIKYLLLLLRYIETNYKLYLLHIISTYDTRTPHWTCHIIQVLLHIFLIPQLFLTTLTDSGTDMNYETFIKEGQHLKTLLTLTKLTKKERVSTRKELEQLLDGYIFYPISTWPPSIK